MSYQELPNGWIIRLWALSFVTQEDSLFYLENIRCQRSLPPWVKNTDISLDYQPLLGLEKNILKHWKDIAIRVATQWVSGEIPHSDQIILGESGWIQSLIESLYHV